MKILGNILLFCFEKFWAIIVPLFFSGLVASAGWAYNRNAELTEAQNTIKYNTGRIDRFVESFGAKLDLISDKVTGISIDVAGVRGELRGLRTTQIKGK